MAPSIDLVLSTGALLGECPVWSPEQGLLYWIDIDGCAVHALDPDHSFDMVWELPARPGAIALTGDPARVLVAMETELGWLSLTSGEYTPWVTLEDKQPGVRLNDGRCDASGRFWVGGMFVPTSAGRFEAFLHRIEPSGAFDTVRRDVGCANGLAFSPDKSVMYWADTLHETVWAYDYDIDSGQQRNERVFMNFDPLPGRPDGACVDETGCYWVACVGGSALVRVTPNGDVDRLIEMPVKRPTMPAFGGPDLATMYVTTIGPRDPDEPGDPGAIYAFDPGVRGMVEPKFAG